MPGNSNGSLDLWCTVAYTCLVQRKQLAELNEMDFFPVVFRAIDDLIDLNSFPTSLDFLPADQL